MVRSGIVPDRNGQTLLGGRSREGDNMLRQECNDNNSVQVHTRGEDPHHAGGILEGGNGESTTSAKGDQARFPLNS